MFDRCTKGMMVVCVAVGVWCGGSGVVVWWCGGEEEWGTGGG